MAKYKLTLSTSEGEVMQTWSVTADVLLAGDCDEETGHIFLVEDCRDWSIQTAVWAAIYRKEAGK